LADQYGVVNLPSGLTESTGVGPPRRLVLFDLDRTLIPGSSLIVLARELIGRGFLPQRLIVSASVRHAMFTRRGASDHTVGHLKDAALAAVAGMAVTDLNDVALAVAREVMHRVYPEARALVRQHVNAGHFCVLLSASPQEVVQRVAQRLDMQRAIGTQVAVADGHLLSRLVGDFCYGPGKISRLAQELGDVDYSQATAYSDSASDAALLSRCGKAVAVCPDRRLRAIAEARGWPVLRFAS
jgi:HAD superfamily hydrolase (TIGR01490 family)